MALSANITGLPALRRNLDRFKSDLTQAGKVALAKTAVEVFQASQDLVPFDTGVLQVSGAISEVVELSDGNLAVAISYGEGINYAVVQHEDQDLKHERGQAKYLEVPAYGIGPGALERNVQAEIGKVLK